MNEQTNISMKVLKMTKKNCHVILQYHLENVNAPKKTENLIKKANEINLHNSATHWPSERNGNECTFVCLFV